jgi:osmotically-inducible protein OsmY
MNAKPQVPRETSREEDFRDYEERDLDEGWPYPDLDSGQSKRNEAYGRSPAGLEGGSNDGVEIASNPVIQSEGGPSLSQSVASEAIEDDALEEQIYDRFSQYPDLGDDQVTVTVRHGVAELSGRVETQEISVRAEQIAAATPGVVAVRNALVLIGVDSHIPRDATE